MYIDLVAGLNFLVDFLLLMAANRLAGFEGGVRRAALAAALGGVYGGACLVPGFRFLGNTLWRLVSLCLMSVIAFGWNTGALRRGGLFVILSMALGGIALGLGSGGFWSLMAGTLGLCGLCALGFKSQGWGQRYVPVELSYGSRRMRLTALRDTGNTLRDPVTGKPVLVAGAEVAEELTGLTREQLQAPVETVTAAPIPGLRLVPYRAVGQKGGMLLALRMNDVKIGKSRGNALVAFAPEGLSMEGEYQALAGGMVC